MMGNALQMCDDWRGSFFIIGGSIMYSHRAEQTTLETLLEQFDVRNEGRVKQYLQQCSFLLPLILEAKA
jgi:hypothetical protein